jgi:hypothetical protein
MRQQINRENDSRLQQKPAMSIMMKEIVGDES